MNSKNESAEPDSTWLTVERTPNSADFFDAAARGELLLERCDNCSHLRIARRPTCRACGHSAATGLAAAGVGTLITWGVHPGRGESSDPQVFGMVELAEGPWMESALVAVDDTELRVGLALKVTWVRGPEGEVYPAFTAAE